MGFNTRESVLRHLCYLPALSACPVLPSASKSPAVEALSRWCSAYPILYFSSHGLALKKGSALGSASCHAHCDKSVFGANNKLVVVRPGTSLVGWSRALGRTSMEKPYKVKSILSSQSQFQFGPSAQEVYMGPLLFMGQMGGSLLNTSIFYSLFTPTDSA